MAFNDQALKSIFDNADDFFKQRDNRRQEQELIILKSLLENDNIEPVIEQGSSSNLEQSMGLTPAPKFSFRRKTTANLDERKFALDQDKFQFDKDKQGFAEEKELNDNLEKLLDQARQQTSAAMGSDLLRISQREKGNKEAFKAEFTSQVETLLQGQLETINPKYREQFKNAVYAQLGKKTSQIDSDGFESLANSSSLTPTEQLLKVLNDMPNREEAIRILESAQNDPESIETNKDIDFNSIRQALQLPKKSVTQSDSEVDLKPRGDNPLMTENLPSKKKGPGYTQDKGDFKMSETMRQDLRKKGNLVMDRNKLRRPLTEIERSILMSKDNPDDPASYSQEEMIALANELYRQQILGGNPGGNQVIGNAGFNPQQMQMQGVNPQVMKMLMDSQKHGAITTAPGSSSNKKRPYTRSNF